ncbi:MAG: ATPase domain-containing protein [archaeon]|nr:AAA family ATPase [Candidatus Micrarchaeota archaeon]
MVEIPRTRTGVPGLDELMDGGIPRGNLVVLAGDPGSGKSCLCLSYLYQGVTKYDEPGIYISLEESVDEIVRDGKQFGWDFKKLMKEKRILIETVELYDFDKLKNLIEDSIQVIEAKRLVIDPGVIFRLYFERELDARKRIMSLGKMLKLIDCTTIITNEINLDKTRSLFGLEEYVADGVILLYHTKIENRFVRSVGVLKMRGTKISEKLHPIVISSTGVKILAKQELFEEF